MASRDPKLMHHELYALWCEFDLRMRAANINYVVCCTYRSNDEQNALYAIGRTVPGRIITCAKGGQSAHNYQHDNAPCALAFDIACFENGKYAPDNSPLWFQAGKIGQNVGLDWAGAPDFPFHELAHFQLKNWKKYAI